MFDEDDFDSVNLQPDETFFDTTPDYDPIVAQPDGGFGVSDPVVGGFDFGSDPTANPIYNSTPLLDQGQRAGVMSTLSALETPTGPTFWDRVGAVGDVMQATGKAMQGRGGDPSAHAASATSLPGAPNLSGGYSYHQQQPVLFSDARLKAGVRTVGHDDRGRRWVDFTYRWGGPRRRGVVAQEVARSDPQAVSVHPSGYLLVDYSRLRRG